MTTNSNVWNLPGSSFLLSIKKKNILFVCLFFKKSFVTYETIKNLTMIGDVV